MEDILIILLGILALAVIVVVSLYNNMDRLRYRLDTLLRRARPALDEWADMCQSLHPGSADEYRRARRNWQKTACLQKMVETVKENSEEKLNLQEELLDFCFQFRYMAEKYNDKLESSVFKKLYHVLGFRPYTPLDFYPHIRPIKPEE